MSQSKDVEINVSVYGRTGARFMSLHMGIATKFLMEFVLR